MMTSDSTYGTVECYAEMFSDILADVELEGPYKDSMDNIIQGFYRAIDDWLEYHQNQSEAYKQMKARVKAALDD
jgi:hypothetical protein